MISVEILLTTTNVDSWPKKLSNSKSSEITTLAVSPFLAMTVCATVVLVHVPVWFFQEIFERNKEKCYEEAAERKERTGSLQSTLE